MRTRKHTYLKKINKKKKRKKTAKGKNKLKSSCTCCVCYKCPRRNYAANGKDGPAGVPGEDGTSDTLPANEQHGEQSLEDGRETIF